MNKNIVALMLGLGLSLGVLTAEAGPRWECNSVDSCLAKERTCVNNGTPYQVCDRMLTRCLEAALNCRG